MLNEQTIGIKELHRNLKTIAEKTSQGEEFLVIRNSRPAFRIVPLQKTSTKRKYNLRDFRQLQFRSGQKNLSRQIDQIVYRWRCQ